MIRTPRREIATTYLFVVDHEEYQIHQYFGLMTRVHLHLYKGEYESALEQVADAQALRRAMVDQVHFVRSDFSLSIRVRVSLAALTSSRQPANLRARIDKDIRLLRKIQRVGFALRQTASEGSILLSSRRKRSAGNQASRRHRGTDASRPHWIRKCSPGETRRIDCGPAGQLELKAGHDAFVLLVGVRNPERFSPYTHQTSAAQRVLRAQETTK